MEIRISETLEARRAKTKKNAQSLPALRVVDSPYMAGAQR
jgi:hypothetical protein